MKAGINYNRKAADEQKIRTIYLDYLRVFATFAVMILHLSASNWYTTDVNGFKWQVFNFFDSIVRWCVPVFVMISGALFLNRDISLKTLYGKYVLRMVIAFVTWSFFYALFIEGSMMDKISMLMRGPYHMWFILMIIGIYICMPLIKPILESDLRVKYYLALTFVFAFALPELFTLINDFGGELIVKGSNVISTNVYNMNMHMVLGYASYFVLGYFVNKQEMSIRQRIVIYALGILGFVFTVVMDAFVALKTQMFCDHYYGYFNVNVLLEALAVFTLFKYSKFKSKRMNGMFSRLSKYCFGAYLIHVLVIEQLDSRFGLNTLSLNPVVAVLFLGVIVFLVSFLISALLNRIPIIRKFLV